MTRHLYLPLALFLFCCAFGQAQPSCTPPPSGLVAWWPGDGNANDVIGGYNGTLNGGVSFAAGEVGQAFALDGTTGFVQVPSSPALMPPSAISVSAWINPTSLAPFLWGTAIASKYDSSKGGGHSWLLQVAYSGQIDWQVEDAQTPAYAEVGTKQSIVVGAWQHLVATFDTATQSIAVYVNGQPFDTVSYTTGTVTSMNQSTADVLIGAYDAGAAGYFFGGQIDEVQIFNRALSASEILAIYNAGTAGECKSLPTLTVSPRMGIFKAGGYNDESDAIPPVNYTIQAGTVPAISFSGITGLWTCHSGDPTYSPDGTSGTCNVPAGRHVNPTGPFSGYGTTDFAGGLVGMFLEDTLPASEPPSLQFYANDTSKGGTQTNFTSLSPALGQVFFIGDGLTGTGTGSVQTFQVPPSATHLYLGYVDSCDGKVPKCYGDNTGSVAVTVSNSCGFSVSPTSQSFPAGGGNGVIVVTTLLPPSSCSYSVQANDTWIHTGSCTTGHSLCFGNAVLDTVEPNTGPNQRIGTLTIAGQTVTITQSGTTTCTYGIKPTGQTFSENGGHGTVSVSAQTGCSWSAGSNVSWATINSGSSGSGSGSVTFTVSPNAGTPRNGTLTIAGQTYSITQSASGCGATDVSNKVIVGRGPYLGDALGNYWIQTVSLFNISNQPVAGPIYLVMDGLPRTGYPCTEIGVADPTCDVQQAAGVTYCGSFTGSDLVLFSSGSIAPSQQLSEQLSFLPPPGGLEPVGSSGPNGDFAYTTRVFSGTPSDISRRPGGELGRSTDAGLPAPAVSGSGATPTVTYWVSLDTAPLIGHPAGPFSLTVQLADGSGTNDGNNAAVVGAFQFGTGGAPSATPTVTGSAFGDLSTTVSLTDSSTVNFFYQTFTPGTSLSFPIVVTANADAGGILDEFALYVLDNTLTPLPTLAGAPLDIFASINLTTSPVLKIYAGDTSRSPAGGGGPISIPAPFVVITSPSGLNLGMQQVGTTSAAKNVKVINAGVTALTISGISVTGADAGDFAQSNTCPAAPSTLAAGASCTISVTFTPSASGNRQATLSISEDEGAPQTVVLSGKGM